MAAKLKAFALNSLLVIASILVAYFIIELVFFRLLLPDARFSPRPFLPETPGVLVQTTKAGYAPRDYIAIMGDSYAEGVGDEMLHAHDDDSKLFHAADVIHARTGRDVVTFGHGGAGSAEAYVRLPTRAISGSHCIIFPTIEDPKQILAYFYEGNDIEDNLAFTQKVAAQYGRADAGTIDRYLDEEYGTFSSWRCHFYLADNISRMVNFLKTRRLEHIDPFATSRINRNVFTIAGKDVPTPAVLGPALAIAPADIRRAIEVFDRSLAWLRRRFASAPITVIYIPSPLATYRLAAPRVAYLSYDEAGYHDREAAAARVAANSDLLCGLVREVVARRGAGFLDARPALRAVAAGQPIHGPIDWLHPNHAGYQVLGDLLARRLGDTATVDRCDSAPPGLAERPFASDLP